MISKRLGQYFLNDEKILRQIANLLEINSSDVVVEIGPGHGELTRYLLEAGPKKILTIEKDKELVYKLRQSIKNTAYSKTLEVIEGDVLKILPQSPKSYIPNFKSYKLVGNIPYYITGYLFRVISELTRKPETIVFTIQKEVAERICAKPPKMNMLAASVQFWAMPTIAGVVSKKAFSPTPEVDSAIIKLVPKTVDKKVVKQYYELIKIIFKQPRKTVLNNISAGTGITKEDVVKKLGKHGVEPAVRPQDLSIGDLISLSNVFHAKK